MTPLPRSLHRLPGCWSLLPLAGAAILLLGGRRVNALGPPARRAAAARLASCSALVLFFALLAKPAATSAVSTSTCTPGSRCRGFQADAGFQLDQLSIVFVLLITGVGSLIHIYSVGYMAHDEHRRQFFGYLNLFLAAMLLLVLADNYLLLYVGWEGVGLASYLLIGFWQHKPRGGGRGQEGVHRQPGRRRRPVDRDHADVHRPSAASPSAGASTARPGAQDRHADGDRPDAAARRVRQVGAVPAAVLAAATRWRARPRSSALIHAATMVTAGVYLIARSNADLRPRRRTRGSSVTIVGAVTLLFGAIIGCAKDDIKKALAGSTMSQIGYMILAAGLGPIGYVFAIMHLITHGFFKAGLFLGAGSVMHGMNDDVDMRHYGGLRKYMPLTFVDLRPRLPGDHRLPAVRPASSPRTRSSRRRSPRAAPWAGSSARPPCSARGSPRST